MSTNKDSLPSSAIVVDISQINDYLIWSIVNLFFGYGLFGIIPLIFSIICRNNKQNNNITGAQHMSTFALAFNIMITIAGAIVWIIFFIYISIYAIALQTLT